MASLKDVPVVLRAVGPFAFAKKVYFEVNDDNLFTWAASLAYSWLFAIFPFFVFLLTLIPLLPHDWKQESVRRIDSAVNTLPRETAEVLHSYLDPKLKQLLYQPPPALKSILSIGLLVTIWAASGGLATTMAAMNKCYDIETVRPFYKQRPLAVLLTIVVASLIISVIILIPVGTVLTKWLTAYGQRAIAVVPGASAATMPASAQLILNPIWVFLWNLFRYGVGLLLMMTVVAILYHFGPAMKQKWRILTPGAVFTIGCWIGLGLVFRIYIDKYGKYGQTYGAVGGVAILLLLFYLDALLLLVGAEINSEIDNAMRQIKPATPVPPPEPEVPSPS